MRFMPDQAPKRGKSWMAVAGIVPFFALCAGPIYLTSRVIVGGEGLQGIILGAIIGFFVYLILNAAVAPLARRVCPGRLRTFQSGLIIVVVAILGFFFVWPFLHKDPSTYYTGDPTAQYQITYSDGKQEVRTGAAIGIEKWEFAAGVRVGVAAAVLLLAFFSAFERDPSPGAKET